MTGIVFWFLLGFHDALAALGLSTFQYVMEYGFLGFALAVLWVVFNDYLEIAAEEKYRVITEFANDCIMVVQDETVVFENPACRHFWGRSLETSHPGDFFRMIPPEERRGVLDHFKTLKAGDREPMRYAFSIGKKDGERRFMEIASSAIQYRNRPAILTVMRDITERKQAEEALRETEEKLARSRKMESIGILAGGVAHDLNNVLSGIISYPELMLLDMAPDHKFRNLLERIQDAGRRAAAIVDDLLTVARGIAITKVTFNFNGIVRDYLDSPEFKKTQHYHPAVSVQTLLDEDLLNVNGSPAHVMKAVMNLVSNASEAIEGKGNVTISTMNRYPGSSRPGIRSCQ